MLNITNLQKTYGRGAKALTALKDVSFECPTGITALLGPNGSGKSTFMNIAATLVKPTSGTISYDGVTLNGSNVEHIRSTIGIVPQHINLPKKMSIEKVLQYLGWVHGQSTAETSAKISEVLERLELTDKRHAQVAALSGGQLRRAGFACAMIADPKLLLLDEPTVGLDPEVRMEIRALIKNLGENSTVVISTHLLEDVKQLAPHVVLLKSGEVKYQGSYRAFINKGDTQRIQTPGQDQNVENAYQNLIGH